MNGLKRETYFNSLVHKISNCSLYIIHIGCKTVLALGLLL